jgi:predicted phosphodiesterase
MNQKHNQDELSDETIRKLFREGQRISDIMKDTGIGGYKAARLKNTANKKRVVIASDFHVPHINKPLVETFLRWLKKEYIDHLVINGDFLDAEPISRFVGSHKHTLADEIWQGKALLSQLQKAARACNSDARITFIEGNHEARLTKFMLSNAKEIMGIMAADGYEVVSVPHLLNLKDRKIDHLTYSQVLELGAGLFVEHGDRVSKNAGQTAMNVVKDKGASVVLGHVHRQGMYYKTDRQGVHVGVEAGCMCTLDPSYITDKSANWQGGFAIADFDTSESDGAFALQLVPWLNGKIYVDGKFI